MGYYFRYYGDYTWDYCLYDKTETDWEGDRYMDYLNFVKNQDITFLYNRYYILGFFKELLK